MTAQTAASASVGSSSVPQWTIDGLEQLDNVWVGIEEDFEWTEYTGMLNSFVDVLREAHRGFFDRQTEPGGSPWKPLSRTTINKKGHDRILFEHGPLRESLVGQTSDSIVEIIQDGAGNQHGLSFGTSVPYAIFHRTGTSRMPKREPVGLNNALLERLANAVADHTVESMKP